jgi:general secretion pathway protein G
MKMWEFVLILVMAAVIALGVGIIVNHRLDNAVTEQVNNDFLRLAAALHQYKLDNKRYPTTEQGLLALYTKPDSKPLAPRWQGPYISRVTLITGPWKNSYQYSSSSAPPGFELISLGADAKPEGVGRNADIYFRFESDAH